MARPPLALSRLSQRPDGKVLFTLRRPWRDGTQALLFEPEAFVERLCIFAPSAAWRAQIVPVGEQRRALRRKQKERAALGQMVPPDASRWTPWLVLLARVFGADLARCPGCGASCWADDLVLGAGCSKRELLLLGVRRESLRFEASRGPPEDWEV